MPYVYKAALWCDSCGRVIKDRLIAEGKAPTDIDSEHTWDSDDFPKYVMDPGESDCPSHCDAGEECLEAEDLGCGHKVGALIDTRLTDAGIEYVRNAHRERPTGVTSLWMHAFDIDFDDDSDESEDPIGPFLEQYIETALWSSTDESTPSGGNPMDENYDIDDMAQEAIDAMRKDCNAFVEQAGDLINGFDETDVAHDFWLTRNRHGVGFWDGDYPEPQATKLTDLAHGFGECHLYVGDDGKVYVE